MDIRELLSIDRVQGPNGPNQTGQTPEGKPFQQVLQELQDIAKTRSTDGEPVPSDLKDFSKAMRAADDEYVALMDIRRKLEQAFEAHDK